MCSHIKYVIILKIIGLINNIIIRNKRFSLVGYVKCFRNCYRSIRGFKLFY